MKNKFFIPSILICIISISLFIKDYHSIQKLTDLELKIYEEKYLKDNLGNISPYTISNPYKRGKKGLIMFSIILWGTLFLTFFWLGFGDYIVKLRDIICSNIRNKKYANNSLKDNIIEKKSIKQFKKKKSRKERKEENKKKR